MSTKTIWHYDGTATVLHDSYSPHGTIGGTPSRPERDHQRENSADKMTNAERAKMLSTPVDRLDYWDRWGAPKAIGRRVIGTSRSWEPLFSKKAYAKWIAELREVGEMVARIRV